MFSINWFKKSPKETKFEKLVRERKEKEETLATDKLKEEENFKRDAYVNVPPGNILLAEEKENDDEWYKESGFSIMKSQKKNKKAKTKFTQELPNVTIKNDLIVLNKSIKNIIDFNEKKYVVLYIRGRMIIFDFTNDFNREGALKINKYEKVSYIYLRNVLPPELQGKHNLHKKEIFLRKNIISLPRNYREIATNAAGGCSGGFRERRIGEKWVLEW